MMHSSDAVPSNSAKEELESRTELDFLLPVILCSIKLHRQAIQRRVRACQF